MSKNETVQMKLKKAHNQITQIKIRKKKKYFKIFLKTTTQIPKMLCFLNVKL